MNARETALVQKYAQSFVDKVYDREDIWTMYDQISAILTVIHDSKLNRILLSATVSQAEKAEFIHAIRQSTYREVNDLIEAVARDGHADLLVDILEAVLVSISKSKQEFDAYVVSVYPLTDEQKERVRHLVENRFSLKVRNIVEEIDKEVLGGFIITINHKVLDASVRTQLKEIRNRL
ncbi:F0F1 ATP synthase subunit delta [Streptococcus azizii]|uniref:ATP synthase subunit delta n=1 Tax=Streptococcus azizii TaxID=1579424 RepID=A0AB36JQ42_9STRE|nr:MULTISPECIES: F0F1 ATP synthase subunit delta [Streptococcus]MBF0775889.1 F0F1 ATP synthase subunit delta [Streptococcus sp. 19428wD3_AN2]ONK27472.1 F0F1 ATP synthase subunit delta [Streptococcus azizii]ONK28709.1 F0F1 ATP synthase subunit delta [Streptococcus azizii]ONK29405.1 F0F1 ATP synthase subunit delta [Streptococcus azizii]TFU83938.1 F0F1 ATP synthase subunit delta [Streptococcus sp. AN2]